MTEPDDAGTEAVSVKVAVGNLDVSSAVERKYESRGGSSVWIDPTYTVTVPAVTRPPDTVT